MLNQSQTTREARETFQKQQVEKQYGEGTYLTMVELARREAANAATTAWLFLGATRSEKGKERQRTRVARMEQVAEALAGYRDELKAAA